MTDEKKTTSDGRLVTKQEYIDEVKAEMERFEKLTDEELDAEMADLMDKEPESDGKELIKHMLNMLK